MGPLGLSRPQRGRGEGKKAEEQSPFRYLGESEQGRKRLERACSLRSGTVLSREVVGETAHSPRQSDSPVRPHRDRGNTERQNANRQVKQVAEGSEEV